jgi:hypothetical protein
MECGKVPVLRKREYDVPQDFIDSPHLHPVLSPPSLTRTFNDIRFTTYSTPPDYELLPFILFPDIEVKGGDFGRYYTGKCVAKNKVDKR